MQHNIRSCGWLRRTPHALIMGSVAGVLMEKYDNILAPAMMHALQFFCALSIFLYLSYGGKGDPRHWRNWLKRGDGSRTEKRHAALQPAQKGSKK